MKKVKYNFILLVLISIIILFFILKDDFYGITDVLLNSNKWYILVILVIILINDLFKSLSMKLLIKEVKNRYTIKDAIILTLKTNFFNAITPFSLGGQPFQLYTLKSDSNIDYATGANILFKDMYSYQLAFVTTGVLCYLLNIFFKIIVFSDLINKLILLGLLINIIFAIFLFFIPYMKNNGHKGINKIIVFLNKIKIIKNKDKTIKKLDDFINSFKVQIDDIKVNFKLMFKCYILNKIKIMTLSVVGYFCFKCVGVDIKISESIIAIILIMIMASFVPIPGASGGMEFGFLSIFSIMAIGAKLNAALILWRFTGYHLVIIVGIITIIMVKNKEVQK